MDQRKKGYKPKSKEWVIDVYLPSQKMKEEWGKSAKKHRMSRTKFVIYAVEEYLQRKAMEMAGIKRYELARELESLRKENEKLKEEKHILELLTQNMERELAMRRFDRTGDELMKIRKPDRSLIYSLRKKEAMSSEEILEVLGVSNISDESVVASINADLEAL